MFDLNTGKYWPFRKPNDSPQYVNRESNHPGNILKEIPEMTSKRLSELSYDKEEFDTVVSDYQSILNQSGYKDKLSYQEPSQNPKNKRKKRSILWFNPPFDLQVKTSVGKMFLKLLDKHFPQHHRLYPILNRHRVKVSYSCMPNIKSNITSHNQKVLAAHNSPKQTPLTQCNCNNAESCPLKGECLTPAVVYKADVKPSNEIEKNYFGISEPPFKGRWQDHNTSFKYPKYKNKSKLSSFVWQCKEKRKGYNIKWSILKKCKPYRPGSKRCYLCLSEKLFIINGNENMINKRDELVNKCRHVDKFLLYNYKEKG